MLEDEFDIFEQNKSENMYYYAMQDLSDMFQCNPSNVSPQPGQGSGSAGKKHYGFCPEEESKDELLPSEEEGAMFAQQINSKGRLSRQERAKRKEVHEPENVETAENFDFQHVNTMD